MAAGDFQRDWMQRTEDSLDEMRRDLTSIKVDAAGTRAELKSLRGRVVMVSSAVGAILSAGVAAVMRHFNL